MAQSLAAKLQPVPKKRYASELRWFSTALRERWVCSHHARSRDERLPPEHSNDSHFLETLLISVIIRGKCLDAEDSVGGLGFETEIQVEQNAGAGRATANHFAVFQVHHRRGGLEMNPASGRVRVQELSVGRVK